MTERYLQNGLTPEEVESRAAAGKINTAVAHTSRTVGQIIRSHVFTLFNLLNFVLAGLIVAVGSWRNLLFMGVVLSNIVIGIIQELRAKATIDRLTLLTAPRVRVLRGGRETGIGVEEIVQDDLMLLENGDQIASDAVVTDGEIEVNEALLTGEADPILKRPGDELRSGSFVVSGHCRARVIHVGGENYVARLTAKAKEMKKVRSALMDAINWIIRFVGYIILPLGILMFCKQFFGLGENITNAVVSTVSSAVGMIPEGLVLLTSVSLAVGVIKLASRKTLVQEMYSIESLARVDVLCLDKTGTITEGHMKLDEIVSLTDEDVRPALSALSAALDDHNPTANAVREAFPVSPDWHVLEKIPFSSARKYSAARFEEGCYALGAAEFLLADRGKSLDSRIQPTTEAGRRVLVFCRAELSGGAVVNAVPLALLEFTDPVRKDAAQTFRYFQEQGVSIRVISGDSAGTVAAVAREAGLDVENAANLDGLTDEEVVALAERTTVFGRVSPSQKRSLVETLQSSGHTVAMTGDGVNDVLALKAADCSIAMAEGSAASRQVSQLVLLDSRFASLPGVVAEGRRVVNNMRRAASLYLVKTIYSALLTLCFLFMGTAWPFRPIQMTLIGALTVGLPSFFLALEPNGERVRSDFLLYVLTHAVPGALSIVLGVLGMTALRGACPMTGGQLSTLCALITGFVGFVVLFRVCVPFNWKRILLFTTCFGLFILIVLFMGHFFMLTPLPPELLPALLIGCAAVTLLTCGFSRLSGWLYRKWKGRSFGKIFRVEK